MSPIVMKQKQNFGVPKETIEKFTVYSVETAIEMAKAVKKLTGSDFAISTTGQLGRFDPNNPDKEHPNHVWYAIVDPNDEFITKEIDVPSTERRYQKEYVTDAISASLLSGIV